MDVAQTESEMTTKKKAPMQEHSNGAKPAPGDSVPVQIRMSSANRQRLKRFAIDQHETLQSLAIKGLNLVLAEKAQKPLKGE